ncbi:MAG: hypothetical protein ACRCVT_06905, partial [Leadbetterella sp.]
VYFVCDPFHVLYNYWDYGSNHNKSLNRNRISTQTFLNYYPKYKFKSFIFGSSRSGAFLTYDWAKHIDDPSPYHFDAFNENISGILGKMRFIEKQGQKLDNVLLVLDNFTFDDHFEKSGSVVHLKDYRWSGQSPLGYHTTFFKGFFKKQYWIHYLDLKINNTYRKHMDEIFKFDYKYVPPFNEFIFEKNEADIRKDSVAYYAADKEFGLRKAQPMMEPMIQTEHLDDLQEVARLLKAHGTKYKVIFSPLYDQRELNTQDIKTLTTVFGKENFYNYAGVNKYTQDKGNYFEIAHYRPHVGRAIMDEIYRKP